MAGLSLQELSDSLGQKVTKQALSKYELGLMKPTSDVLLAIASLLRLKPEYFLKKDQVELGEILFRKKVSLQKKNEESIIEKARDYVERYLEIENILNVDNTFHNPLEEHLIHNYKDVEAASERLRTLWELGNNPISNIVEMLELRGVKILLINEVDDFDGFATFAANGIPFIVVNTSNKSTERIRFTIIHELAHLLLRIDETIKNQEEKLCHCFSTGFLIPSNMLIKMIGGAKRSYIAINELISIKEYYGISIGAIVHRLKELEIITPNYYNRWVIYMSKTYGKKNEPGNYKGEEKLTNFEQLVNRALSEGLISLSKAASLRNINVNELRKEFISVS